MITGGDTLEQIGAEFADRLVVALSSCRTVTVTVKSIDTNAGVANVYIYEGDATFAVPFITIGVGAGVLSVIPTVGSLAAITYLNGNYDTPTFVAFESIDSVRFERSSTQLTLTIDPDDESKDEAVLTIGGSSIRINSDVIEMNGGDKEGLVIVGKLTDRLNKLQTEIDQIQAAIASHSHTYIDSVGSSATPTPKTTTGTTYNMVTLTQVKNDDYINDKITQ